MKTPATDRIYTGDAERVMRAWPDSFVDLVVTSPPYLGLRDYRVEGQLGLEHSVEDYVKRLVAVLDEARRVLKPTGSLFLNLGDSFRDKNLVGVPWRVALALQRQGWILRNAVVWHKPSGLPTPVTDRLVTRYELIFHLVKQRRYYYNLDAIRVPHATVYKPATIRRQQRRGVLAGPVGGNFPPHPKGKNPGDVWTIAPETRAKAAIAPGGDGHIAPFPEALCMRPILAASPPGGIVLDPFAGSGTTAVVTRELGRRYLGIELSSRYARLARRRLAHVDRSRRTFGSCSRRRTASQAVTCTNTPGPTPSFQHPESKS